MGGKVGDKVVLVPLDGMPDNIVAITAGLAIGKARYVDISPSSEYHVSHDCDYGWEDYYTVGSGAGWTTGTILLDLTTVATLFNTPMLVVATGYSIEEVYNWNTDPEISAFVTSHIELSRFYGSSAANSSVSIVRTRYAIIDGNDFFDWGHWRIASQMAMGTVGKTEDTIIKLNIQTANGGKGKVYVGSRGVIVEGSV